MYRNSAAFKEDLRTNNEKKKIDEKDKKV